MPASASNEFVCLPQLQIRFHWDSRLVGKSYIERWVGVGNKSSGGCLPTLPEISVAANASILTAMAVIVGAPSLVLDLIADLICGVVSCLPLSQLWLPRPPFLLLTAKAITDHFCKCRFLPLIYLTLDCLLLSKSVWWKLSFRISFTPKEARKGAIIPPEGTDYWYDNYQ